MIVNIGSTEREPGQDHPKITTAKDDPFLSITERRNRDTTAQFSFDFYAATRKQIQMLLFPENFMRGN